MTTSTDPRPTYPKEMSPAMTTIEKSDDAGWLVRLACGHTFTDAKQRTVGSRPRCAACSAKTGRAVQQKVVSSDPIEEPVAVPTKMVTETPEPEAAPEATVDADGKRQRRTDSLGKGALAPLVLTHMLAADVDLSPSAIGKAIERSSGAIQNALVRMLATGEVQQTSDTPRRYALTAAGKRAARKAAAA